MPKEYPQLFLDTHQMYLVGPRYIPSDGRFYNVNFTIHSCYVHGVRTKSVHGIVDAIVSFW